MTATFAQTLERFLNAIDWARIERPTVAQDVAGLSWAERFVRLEDSGLLLSEDQVKQATLLDVVGPRDFVIESERREQQRRDEEQRLRHSDVKDAGDELVKFVGRKVTKAAVWLAGEKTGAVIGRAFQKLARAYVTVAGWAVRDRFIPTATPGPEIKSR